MVIPINDYILVKELPLVRHSLIHLSDNVFKDFFYGIVERFGGSVYDLTIQQGLFCLCDRLAAIKTKHGTFFKEKDILMVKRGLWRPLGNRVLVRRHIEESVTKSGIIIPACYQTKDQTKDATVICLGIIHNKIIEHPLTAGDNVTIKKWRMDIHEIGIEGSYNLSVPMDLISHKYED